jgi:hypothetical protein
LILALFLLTSVWAAAQTETATLKSVQLQRTETELVAQIECEGAFTYQTFEMADPSRLVVEFSPVTKVMTEAAYEAAAFGVSTIRTAQYQPQVARVVFDVVGAFPLYKISQSLNRVIVTFWKTGPAAADAPAAVPAAPVSAPAAAPAVPADIKGITFERVNDQLKVRIQTAGPAALQGFRLAQPSRLLFIFSPVDKISAPPYVDINRSGVKRAPIEKQDERTYQVVFGLEENQPSFTVDQGLNAVDVLFRQDPQAGRKASAQPAGGYAPQASALRPFPTTYFGALAGSYAIASRAFTDIYGNAGLIFGAELTKFFVSSEKIAFGLSAAFRYFSKDGEASYTKDPTTLTLMPLSVTAVAAFKGGSVAPFLGIGLDRFGYKEKSDYHEVSGGPLGFHAQAGFYYLFPGIDFLAAKLYAKFTQATATQDDLEVKLGGTEFGLSLNFCFGLPKK